MPVDAPTLENGVPLGTREIDGVLVPPGHHVEKRARLGLVIPGVALLGVGWFLAIGTAIGGAIYVIAEPLNTCVGFASQVAWIPLVGPMIALAGQSTPGLTADNGRTSCLAVDGGSWYAGGAAIAIVDTVLQWAGLTMFIIGLAAKRTVVVEDVQIGAGNRSPEWYVSLGAPGSPLGLSFGLKGW